MRLEAQDVQRLVGELAANHVGQRPHLARADASVLDASPDIRSCSRLAIDLPRRLNDLPLALAAVTAERSRRSELAQLVTDHVFGHQHLHVLLAVVNHERHADELRHDRAGTGPRLDRLAAARLPAASALWGTAWGRRTDLFSVIYS